MRSEEDSGGKEEVGSKYHCILAGGGREHMAGTERLKER